MYAVKQVGSSAPVVEYRESMPVKGERSVPSLGNVPTEAVERLRELVDREHTPGAAPARSGSAEPSTENVRSHA